MSLAGWQKRERATREGLRGVPPHRLGDMIHRRDEREGRGGELPTADLVLRELRAEAFVQPA